MIIDFEVTDKLPNITGTLPRNFAGNIPVNRPGHPNDTLFFWAFEKTEGSLTTKSSDEPWLIWLNGGCAPQLHLSESLMTRVQTGSIEHDRTLLRGATSPSLHCPTNRQSEWTHPHSRRAAPV